MGMTADGGCPTPACWQDQVLSLRAVPTSPGSQGDLGWVSIPKVPSSRAGFTGAWSRLHTQPAHFN